ncbi:alpha/beta fold hydrolase [Nitratireductor mangrovi]|uniref:Alpha/beta fold hydrolase n=1 Tax=Nitratireductor mangrovi TaxID=2599600 RepID=A0A5B8L579_9HYPH|nr:alpha/beta fold hydrolase [Nitratireductor mangrovi]
MRDGTLLCPHRIFRSTANLLTFILWLAVLAALAVAALIAYYAWTTRKLAATAEKNIPMAGNTVRIGGDTIHYVEEGDGPPILFIHGLGGQLHHFRQPLFAALRDDYRLVAIDRPGSGYSVRNGSGAGIRAQAGVVAKLIERLGLEKPLLVGHSLGGAIALATALDHPEKVSGLALLAPLTHHQGQRPEGFKGLYIPSPAKRAFLAHTFAIPMALKQAQVTLDFVFGPQTVTEDYAIGGGGYLGLRPSHFEATAADFVAGGEDLPAQEKRYGELAMPVGILFGDKDRVLDHRVHGLAMEGKVKGLDLEILEGIGHMPQFVEPERSAAFIRRMAEKAFAR